MIILSMADMQELYTQSGMQRRTSWLLTLDAPVGNSVARIAVQLSVLQIANDAASLKQLYAVTLHQV